MHVFPFAVFALKAVACPQRQSKHPPGIKGRPQASRRKHERAAGQRKPRTSEDDDGAGAVVPSFTFVGQAYAHLKADLCRGTGRSLSLALRPQYFPVGNLQVGGTKSGAIKLP